MNIAWITEKSMDVSLDHATWTEMTRLLNQNGCVCHLYTGFQKEKKDFGLNGFIHYLPSIKKSGLGYLSVNAAITWLMVSLCFFKKPDVIIMHPSSVPAFWFFSLCRKLRLTPCQFVLDIRTLPVEVSGFLAAFQHLEFSLAVKLAKWAFDGLTVITPFMKKILVDRFGINHEKTGIWTSGANTDIFSAAENPEQNNASTDCLSLIYHGAVSPNRGIDRVIYALEKLNNPAIRLVILGQGSEIQHLIRLVRQKKLESQVEFLKPVPHNQVPDYIRRADAGIIPLPNRLEWRVSSPIKLMEYLAMGKPVIVSDIEAHRDMLGNRNGVFFFHSENIDSMAQCIESVYSQRSDIAEQSKENIVWIRKNYSWNAQAKNLVHYLQRPK